MANPVVIEAPVGQWTKIANNVTTGQFENIGDYRKNVLVTHRDAGDPEPSDFTDSTIIPAGPIAISHTTNIDVWVFPNNSDATFKVSL